VEGGRKRNITEKRSAIGEAPVPAFDCHFKRCVGHEGACRRNEMCQGNRGQPMIEVCQLSSLGTDGKEHGTGGRRTMGSLEKKAGLA